MKKKTIYELGGKCCKLGVACYGSRAFCEITKEKKYFDSGQEEGHEERDEGEERGKMSKGDDTESREEEEGGEASLSQMIKRRMVTP